MPPASQKFVADPAQISLPEAHLHDDYLLGPGQQDEEMARQDAFNFDFDLGAVGDLGEQVSHAFLPFHPRSIDLIHRLSPVERGSSEVSTRN